MNGLRVSSFTELLAAYRKAGIPLGNAIDGGAGSGGTAKQMIPYLDGEVFAFEPFPGNHRFFEGCDPRIRLIPKALAETYKTMTFHIPAVVSEDSEWGRRGLVGYSSGGRLVAEAIREDDLTMECVRADAEVWGEINFVKLDLQGGELDALKGMTSLLPDVSLMWIEFSGQEGLLDFLTEQGFTIYDTEYWFMGEPDGANFDISRRDVVLSNGHRAWAGFRREGSPEADFSQNTGKYQVWTDLVCVNRMDEFERALNLI